MAINNKRIKICRSELDEYSLKRNSLLDFLYGIVRFLGIIIQNIYCVSSYLVLSWIVLLPIVSSWSLAAGATVVETGDDYKYLIEGQRDYTALNESFYSTLERKSKNNFNVKTLRSSSHQQDVRENHHQLNNVRKQGDNVKALEHDLNQVINEKENLVYNQLSQNNNNLNGDSELKNAKLINNDNQSVIANQASALEKAPRVLLLCNHISTADVPLIMQSFSTLTNQSLLWVLDAQFKPTNFGLVCSSHGDFFIAKDSFKDGSLKDHVLKYPDRNLLVLFPEGGFWRKRLEGSNRYALKNGLPMTKYVTHPRFGAFKDLIDASVNVTHIVDATLIYEDIRDPLSILDIALGNRKEPAILNFKVYERSQINPTEDWLRSIWLEKDKLLQQYYENRESAQDGFKVCHAAQIDWFKVFSIHLFYLLVCYLTVYRLFNATSITMLRAKDLYYSNI